MMFGLEFSTSLMTILALGVRLMAVVMFLSSTSAWSSSYSCLELLDFMLTHHGDEASQDASHVPYSPVADIGLEVVLRHKRNTPISNLTLQILRIVLHQTKVSIPHQTAALVRKHTVFNSAITGSRS